MVKLKGVYTKSQVQRSVLKYYFWFLIVNVFLITLLSGGAIQIIHQFVDSSGTEYGPLLPFLSFLFFLPLPACPYL